MVTRWMMARATLLVLASAAAVSAQEDPAEIVAIAIRDQGMPCSNPRDAVPDPAASKPDERAWTIECDEAGYRVVFTGDTGAEVTQLNR